MLPANKFSAIARCTPRGTESITSSNSVVGVLQVAGVQVVLGGADSAFRCVAAEADRELDQFGGCGGSATAAAAAAASSALKVVGSALEAANAMCLALSSGSITVSASDRCMARRCAGVASV